MRYPIAAVLLAGIGCGHLDYEPTLRTEQHIAAVVPTKAEPLVQPSTDFSDKPLISPDKPIDLALLWDLTLVNQPRLREASADVDAAHGRLIQAGLYPNPRLIYNGDEIGLAEAPKGNQIAMLSQEIVTGGKLELGQAAAARGLDAAGVALLSRKFEVLDRIRRAYYDYIALGNTLKSYDTVVASLEQGVEITRANSWRSSNRDQRRICCVSKPCSIRCRPHEPAPSPRKRQPGNSWPLKSGCRTWRGRTRLLSYRRSQIG